MPEREEEKEVDMRNGVVRITSVAFRISELIGGGEVKTDDQFLIKAQDFLEKGFRYSVDKECFESQRMVLT